MDENLVKKLKGFEKKKTAETKWKTETGSFTTSEVIELEGVRIPQFTTKRKMKFHFHVFKKVEDMTPF